MNQLREVYRSYSASLHIDELMRGVFAFFHGFGLLFHTHGVYAELRRIQVRAASLSDRMLLTDTQSTLQYIVDGEEAVRVVLCSGTLLNRRLSAISGVSQINGGTGPDCFAFTDTYMSLSSTTSALGPSP